MSSSASLNPPDPTAIVKLTLAEDIGTGDITAALIPPDTMNKARLMAREAAIFCGLPWAKEVLRQVDPAIECQWLADDGEPVRLNQCLARLRGPARSLLTAERSMLNFLQTLSGTATRCHFYARMVAHTQVKLLDTRKTLPGLREAQKYAVRAGGCSNHRMGLYDAFLIKENHIRACGSLHKAVATARSQLPDLTVEVEIETLDQLEEALTAGADIIMLDNFDLGSMRLAVQTNRNRARLEASGGITEQNLVSVAETGVDYISLGTLTKDCKAVDLTLLFDS